jgi:hypothetical protein
VLNQAARVGDTAGDLDAERQREGGWERVVAAAAHQVEVVESDGVARDADLVVGDRRISDVDDV